MIGYDGDVHAPYAVEWVGPDYEFTAHLRIAGSFRGRSAAGVKLRRLDGAKFTMRMALLTDMLMAAVIDRGIVSGRWGFRKQGANHSIEWRGEA